MGESQAESGAESRVGRWVSASGSVCLLATLLLLPMGVRAVRADPPEAPLMSVDPKLVEAQAEARTGPETAAEFVAPGPVPAAPQPAGPGALQPGAPGVEIRPGVVLLNTQGYNAVPDMQELDPAALFFERQQAVQSKRRDAPASPR